MDPKWIQVVLLLVFYQKTIGNCIEVKEGKSVQINCTPSPGGAMIIWFRVLDTSGMEFIASFSSNGMMKATGTNFSQTFTHSNNNAYGLKLNSFKKSDSGIYSCGSLFKGNQLNFGEVTRLSAVKKTPTVAPRVTQQPLAITPAPCNCGDKNTKGQVLGGTTSPSFACPLIILGPLAGGCGILLLLLLITTIYCNRIRTRRCPHHYKRKPRGAAHEKQMMANRHV